MTSRSFSTLDPNACHPSLVLSEGNRIVTTLSNALDFHRCVHATIPKAVGDWYYECYFSSVAQTSLAGMISIGWAQPNSATNKYVGEDSLAYALLPADGVVRNNATDGVSGIPLIAERVCIGVFLHLSSPGNELITWTVDGNEVASVALPSSKFWVPAITVSGGNAGEVRAELNFGIDCFDNQPAPIV